MNKGEMVAMVRGFLADSVSDASITPQYETVWIETCINTSQLSVARTTLSLRTHTDVPSVAGVQRYALPNDCLAVKGVNILVTANREVRLVRLGEDEFDDIGMDNYVRPGEPTHFKIEFGATRLDNPAPGDIWLYPTPAVATYIIRTKYFQKPTKLVNDSDVSELQEPLHLAVVYYTTVLASRMAQDFDLATTYMSLFQDEMQKNKEMVHMMDRVGVKRGQNAYARNRGGGGSDGGISSWKSEDKLVT